MRLTRAQRTIPTVFHLLGEAENDMTDALGFALSRSTVLTRHLLLDCVAYCGKIDRAQFSLQTGAETEGITDLRISIPGEAAIVLEAKRWSQLPSIHQLEKYLAVFRTAPTSRSAIVCLTNATQAYAEAVLPKAIGGVQVLHRSWRRIRQMAELARRKEGHQTKHILTEFVHYLEGIIGMETRSSNMVYVVSLGAGTPRGWTISWIDIVHKRRRYFYPVGPRWPAPPNYLGFRYEGRLQSIHHIESFEIFTDPHTIFPEAVPADWKEHYCFNLGPPFRPPHEVRSGPRVQRSCRVHCMLDTLFTAPTISEALEETKRRMA